MLIVMKILYLYPLEVYNFELRFSGNVIQNGCISLSFLLPCRIILSPFSQTRSERHISQVWYLKSILDAIVPFLFSKFVHFEINAPLN